MLVINVVWRQWSDQYVSKTFISVNVGFLLSDLKYFWVAFKSSIVIARPNSTIKFFSSLSLNSINPSNVLISLGTLASLVSAFGTLSPISLESTGFIKYFFSTTNSFSEISSNTYICEALILGLSSLFKSIKHCAAESALWSYCPGKYSTLKVFWFSFVSKE